MNKCFPVLAALAVTATSFATVLIDEDFESTLQSATFTNGQMVASARVIDPDVSPPFSGEKDFVEIGGEGELWYALQPFPYSTKVCGLNTLGLEWSFSVTEPDVVTHLYCEYGRNATTNAALLFRVLDTATSNIVASGATEPISGFYTMGTAALDLPVGDYLIQITSDYYQSQSGCVVDNLRVETLQKDVYVDTWDVRLDFSIVDNPNGEWSYGTLDENFENFEFGASNGSYWELYNPGRPAEGWIWVNNSGAIDGGVEPGQLSLHPRLKNGDIWGEGYPAVVRWIAPHSGTARVFGRFYEGNIGWDTNRIHYAGAPEWTGEAGEFAVTIEIAAGETIDLCAGGRWNHGSTPLEAYVELTYTNSTTNLLIVSSEYGNPNPPAGTNEVLSGTTVACSVDSVTDGLTNYSATGWTLSNGQEPTSGSTNWLELTSTTNSTLTWNWQTNYWLAVNAVGSGSVDVGDGFYARDSEQILTATPDSGWLFMGWSGDASGTNEAFVMMDAPKTVTATFSNDADGDGLLNSNEMAIGSNPWKADSDSDGFGDKLEVDHGWNPTVSDQWVVDHIVANGSTFGLYPSNVVLDVSVGQMVIETAGSMATLSLQLEESDDLVSWTNAGPPEVWSWPMDGEKKFFRVRSGE